MFRQKRLGFHWRGLIGGLVLVPLAALTLFSAPAVAKGSWLELGMNALAFVLFIVGLFIRLWSTLYIGGRKEEIVVQDGPYSVCRNPLYVGSLLVAISFGLFLKSFVFAGGLVLMAVFYMRVTIPVEETMLREKLGEEYTRYCQRVPRFWPRFSQYTTPPMVEVVMKGMRLEFKRAARWVWLPLLGQAVAQLRSETWWPHWFRII